MEQTLPDYVFWYCPSDEHCFQWIGIILWQFLALMAEKWLFLPPEAQITQFLNSKHGKKWNTLYQSMYFDTALQMKLVSSGLVIILWQFLPIWLKNEYFCHQRLKILIFETINMVQMKQTLPDYVLWYYPLDEHRFQWIGHNFIVLFLAFYGKKN